MTVKTTLATRSRPASIACPRSAVVGGVGAVLLVISPLGLGWLFSPAVAAAHIPAMTLNFADLGTLSSSGRVPTNWIQENYFSWIGWALIALTIVATGAAAVTGRRPLRVLSVILSVAGLLVSLFAAKGVLSWSQFSREIPNLRVGVCLLIVGYLLTLAAGVIQDGAKRNSPHHEGKNLDES
jgi:hypothetical protein